MPFNDQFSRVSGAYAAFRPTYPAALVDWLASIAPALDCVWDAGCGNGQLSALLAQRFTRVIATDASANQIANATKLPNIEYSVTPSESPALNDGIADLVTVAQAAHWFDLPRFYDAVRRVARHHRDRSAVLALISYGNVELDPPLQSIVSDFYFNVTYPYWDSSRRLVDNQLRDIPFPFPAVVPPAQSGATKAPQLAIEKEMTPDQFLGYVSTWSGLNNMLAQKPESAAQYERFQHELRDVWGGGVRLVRWPLTLRAGYIR